MPIVTMPRLGESVAEGTIVRWLKAAGDAVAVDEPLFEVSTDKVNTEIPSLYAGVVDAILVPEGATVPVGAELVRIESAGGAHRHAHSPVVRRLAREHRLDLTAVSGSGRNGRVTRGDVLARIGTPVADASVTRRPLSPLRARVAENVLAAKRSVADVFSVIEADMENVHAVRTAAPQKLTYLPFIARAAVEALRAFPAVNARIDGTALVYNEDVRLGIAVDVDERGLAVPVIGNAGELTVTGLARAIASVASAARAGSLPNTAYAGSTFTITNNGTYGTLLTAPIINPPNVATLSTDVVEERVVAMRGAIVVRRRMYLCMSWDHRAFDGSTAGKFLARIKHELETRDWNTQL